MCLLRLKDHIKWSLQSNLLISLFINISELTHQTWWPEQGFVKSEDKGMTLCLSPRQVHRVPFSVTQMEILSSWVLLHDIMQAPAQGSLPEILVDSASCQYSFAPSHQLMMKGNRDLPLLVVTCLIAEPSTWQKQLKEGLFPLLFPRDLFTMVGGE